MYSLDYDRIAVLDYLKQSIERMRQLAQAISDRIGSEILAVADQIADDAAKLEAELIAVGHILPKAATQS